MYGVSTVAVDVGGVLIVRVVVIDVLFPALASTCRTVVVSRDDGIGIESAQIGYSWTAYASGNFLQGAA